MKPDLVNRALLAATVIVAAIGVVDALRDDQGDVTLLLVVVLALQAALIARISYGRPAVPIRADLVAWLNQRATEGSESVQQVADRAVSSYCAGLVGSDDPPIRTSRRFDGD